MIFLNLNLRQAMISNQILSVDHILFQEIAMTMYMIHNGSFPCCFNEFFIETSHPMSTRSNRSFNLENPRIQLTKQSLNYKGNLVWNKIPNNVKYIRNAQPCQLYSKESFKQKLKEFILAEGPVATGLHLSDILYSNRDF